MEARHIDGVEAAVELAVLLVELLVVLVEGVVRLLFFSGVVYAPVSGLAGADGVPLEDSKKARRASAIDLRGAYRSTFELADAGDADAIIGFPLFVEAFTLISSAGWIPSRTAHRDAWSNLPGTRASFWHTRWRRS